MSNHRWVVLCPLVQIVRWCYSRRAVWRSSPCRLELVGLTKYLHNQGHDPNRTQFKKYVKSFGMP